MSGQRTTLQQFVRPEAAHDARRRSAQAGMSPLDKPNDAPLQLSDPSIRHAQSLKLTIHDRYQPLQVDTGPQGGDLSSPVRATSARADDLGGRGVLEGSIIGDTDDDDSSHGTVVLDTVEDGYADVARGDAGLARNAGYDSRWKKSRYHSAPVLDEVEGDAASGSGHDRKHGGTSMNDKPRSDRQRKSKGSVGDGHHSRYGGQPSSNPRLAWETSPNEYNQPAYGHGKDDFDDRHNQSRAEDSPVSDHQARMSAQESNGDEEENRELTATTMHGLKRKQAPQDNDSELDFTLSEMATMDYTVLATESADHLPSHLAAPSTPAHIDPQQNLRQLLHDIYTSSSSSSSHKPTTRSSSPSSPSPSASASAAHDTDINANDPLTSRPSSSSSSTSTSSSSPSHWLLTHFWHLPQHDWETTGEDLLALLTTVQAELRAARRDKRALMLAYEERLRARVELVQGRRAEVEGRVGDLYRGFDRMLGVA